MCQRLLVGKHSLKIQAKRRLRGILQSTRIVARDDRFGTMKEALSAKPQTFLTGDGWFVYNLAVNLAQM